MRKKCPQLAQVSVKHSYEASYLARNYLEMAYEQVLPQHLYSPQKKQVKRSEHPLARSSKSERKIG